ncbi:MAG: hypothetical protein N838_25965 [Thiohalocapsa sp. PB-PSB1]|jgi:hypothetical protein|nr:MAG: hypothetical protein N838_25965 [Thiohalocapsa sp. PB-PSB1]
MPQRLADRAIRPKSRKGKKEEKKERMIIDPTLLFDLTLLFCSSTASHQRIGAPACSAMKIAISRSLSKRPRRARLRLSQIQ